jgi:hypothetical protein
LSVTFASIGIDVGSDSRSPLPATGVARRPARLIGYIRKPNWL